MLLYFQHYGRGTRWMRTPALWCPSEPNHAGRIRWHQIEDHFDQVHDWNVIVIRDAGQIVDGRVRLDR
ncbi:hypothetical protein ACFFX0_24005 [Citricoccus parietis]|uniref:Uncharacterized protein n=1 Tax=Citricoccus parietis TaxID=592307 RepID=A0ABV5G5A9_9MICC